MKYFKILSYFLSCIGLLTVACSDDSDSLETISSSKILYAELSIDNYLKTEPQTRQGPWASDGWTLTGQFTNGEVVGFFSRYGNVNTERSKGPLINIPLYYSSITYTPEGQKEQSIVSFVNPEYEIDTYSITDANQIFMYYPYSEDMGDISNYDASTGNMESNEESPMPGLELRVRDPNDGILKCRNFLGTTSINSTNLKKGIINGTFTHLNYELIFMRGEGFDDPKNENEEPDYTITVVLDRGFSHVRVVSASTTFSAWTNQLYYQEGYTVDGVPKSEEDCKRWQAWKGGQYTYNGVKRDGYYVLLPTVKTAFTNTTETYISQYTTTPKIMYVEMYDNYGNLQRVTNVGRPYGTAGWILKSLESNVKDYLLIQMSELGAKISQVQIDNWESEGDDKNITDTRSAGITTVKQYNDWVTAYNSYNITTSQDKEGSTEELKKYGDIINNVWHFYINGNISFSPSNPPSIVENLNDVLIGTKNMNNYSLSNIYISGPLFKNINENGGVENLDFDGININTINTTSSDPTGCLAGSINNAQIKNCRIINGSVISTGPVGILAGSMNGGKVSDCSFSGVLQGSQTASGKWEKVLGENPTTEPQSENNSIFNLFFSPN